MIKTTAIIFVACLFAACSSTTVILLPDLDGSVGTASVKTEEASKTIDAAYTYTTVSSLTSDPSRVKKIEEKTLALSENQTRLELAMAKLEARRAKLEKIKSQL